MQTDKAESDMSVKAQAFEQGLACAEQKRAE